MTALPSQPVPLRRQLGYVHFVLLVPTTTGLVSFGLFDPYQMAVRKNASRPDMYHFAYAAHETSGSSVAVDVLCRDFGMFDGYSSPLRDWSASESVATGSRESSQSHAELPGTGSLLSNRTVFSHLHCCTMQRSVSICNRCIAAPGLVDVMRERTFCTGDIVCAGPFPALYPANTLT
ncbi:hypothetical protein L226DRAFT_210701 [Lentinus tigrinus ALCF2SS1-7]|uniref:Uncharacterized protein n=1 Tax=Lentinus tigrinus ALCF2SS1-6 TaxID=1328759 RepID=A0A5C2S235_9APHY|nr:hypothetical protein L227DRAFT_245994 [Lentinus tigrinus ALCF2SS1-6]RPD71190.1 hypothetical protein L226DRAFT_210701 [Lentinus tigrinus ALCF2SS1-7]